MSRRRKSLLLVASVLGALPTVTTPAQAEWIAAGCTFRATRFPLGDNDQLWIEETTSYFLGTFDVSSFEVTCWLQTSPNLNSNELPNTRHTCGAATFYGACTNPVFFEANDDVAIYQCVHIEWNDQGNQTLNTGNPATTGHPPDTGNFPGSTGEVHHTTTYDDSPTTPGVQCPLALTT